MLTLVSLPNVDQFLEPTLIHISIGLETELLFLDSHIPSMERECEFQFFDLDSIIEPKPTLEHLIFRVSIGYRTYHSRAQVKHSTKSRSLLDIVINHDDSVMIFQDWSCKKE